MTEQNEVEMTGSLPEETPAENLAASPENEKREESADKVRADYVDMAMRSGVAPLEVRYTQINSLYGKLPIAYRAFTYVNSVLEGVIPPEKYTYASDSTDRGVELARFNIIAAIRAVRALKKAGRHAQFVTARCPASLCAMEDLYAWVKAIFVEQGFTEPEKICLEFPQSLLFENREQARVSLLSMRLLKVKTMMTGCGAEDCPLACLMEVPVESVLLVPELTRLADSRDYGQSFGALIAYIRSLEINVYADGAYSDSQISALSRFDCAGYLPSSGYTGSAQHGRLRMTLDEAVSQQEGEF